jgi:hypothetical protein
MNVMIWSTKMKRRSGLDFRNVLIKTEAAVQLDTEEFQVVASAQRARRPLYDLNSSQAAAENGASD